MPTTTRPSFRGFQRYVEKIELRVRALERGVRTGVIVGLTTEQAEAAAPELAALLDVVRDLDERLRRLEGE